MSTDELPRVNVCADALRPGKGCTLTGVWPCANCGLHFCAGHLQLHEKEPCTSAAEMLSVTTGPTPLGQPNARPDAYVPDGVTFSHADLRVSDRWRHYRGTVYTIRSVSRWSTNGSDEGRAVVEYQSEESCLPCSRFASEFLDGRFRPVIGEEQ